MLEWPSLWIVVCSQRLDRLNDRQTSLLSVLIHMDGFPLWVMVFSWLIKSYLIFLTSRTLPARRDFQDWVISTAEMLVLQWWFTTFSRNQALQTSGEIIRWGFTDIKWDLLRLCLAFLVWLLLNWCTLPMYVTVLMCVVWTRMSHVPKAIC